MTLVEKMVKFGGKEWNGKRVYFNGQVAEKAIGLEYMVYGREGNKKTSYINGQLISNNRGFSLKKDFYYDIEAGKFVGNSSEIIVSFEQGGESMKKIEFNTVTGIYEVSSFGHDTVMTEEKYVADDVKKCGEDITYGCEVSQGTFDFLKKGYGIH